jgi:hypothetical protein
LREKRQLNFLSFPLQFSSGNRSFGTVLSYLPVTAIYASSGDLPAEPATQTSMNWPPVDAAIDPIPNFSYRLAKPPNTQYIKLLLHPQSATMQVDQKIL